MANKILFRRGTKAKLPTLSAGEPAFLIDTRELFVGTGSGNVNMSGSQWYTGTAMSGTSTTTGAYSYSACPLVKLGDIYLNTSNGNVYQCTTAGSGSTAKWTYKGCLKGAVNVDNSLKTNSANAVVNSVISLLFRDIIKIMKDDGLIIQAPASVDATGQMTLAIAGNFGFMARLSRGESLLLYADAALNAYDTIEAEDWGENGEWVDEPRHYQIYCNEVNAGESSIQRFNLSGVEILADGIINW